MEVRGIPPPRSSHPSGWQQDAVPPARGRDGPLPEGGRASVWHLHVPVLQIAFRSAAVYLALLLGLRAFGKREVGQFTLFDLALVLLVANAVQPAMTGPDSSLTGGLVIMVTLFTLNRVVAYLALRSPLARRLIEGRPTVIARSGHWLPRPGAGRAQARGLSPRAARAWARRRARGRPGRARGRRHAVGCPPGRGRAAGNEAARRPDLSARAQPRPGDHELVARNLSEKTLQVST